MLLFWDESAILKASQMLPPAFPFLPRFTAGWCFKLNCTDRPLGRHHNSYSALSALSSCADISL